jgi:FHS family L-fucose permease-like MFS transporter
MAHQQTRWSQFGVLITVFFFWGFVAASNDILIPVFKKAFNLTQAQSQYWCRWRSTWPTPWAR